MRPALSMGCCRERYRPSNEVDDLRNVEIIYQMSES